MKKYLIIICLAFIALGRASEVSAARAPVPFTIIVDNQRIEHESAAASLRSALLEAGIELERFDVSNLDLRAPPATNTTVVIRRAIPLIVEIDGVQTEMMMRPDATLEFVWHWIYLQFSEEGVGLFPISNNQIVLKNEVFSLYSVRAQTVFESEEIPFEIRYSQNDSLFEGTAELSREGVPGEIVREFLIILVAGEETDREEINAITTPPVNEIISVGIRPAPEIIEEQAPQFRLGELFDVNDPNFTYLRSFEVTALAYTSDYASTGKRPGDPGYGYTASGMLAQRGVIAVDRNVIPFGTRLYVEDYGFSIAGDIGGDIRGNMIDIFVETAAEALQWGRRTVRVYILPDCFE